MKFQMVCVNASDLFTVHHFFSAIFLLSAREKNRSRPIFGDGGCVGVGNYSHVSRKFTGEKYRSNVTVPSETEYSLFLFFFFIWKRHASPKRGTEMGNCENLQSFAEEDWREKCSSLWRVNRYGSDLSCFVADSAFSWEEHEWEKVCNG